jgi:hypothetical protein
MFPSSSLIGVSLSDRKGTFDGSHSGLSTRGGGFMFLDGGQCLFKMSDCLMKEWCWSAVVDGNTNPPLDSGRGGGDVY